jgi:hypothetical protein
MNTVELLSDEAKESLESSSPHVLKGVIFLGEGLSHLAFRGRAAVDHNEARQGGKVEHANN